MHSSYVFFTGSACALLLLASAKLLISYRHQPAGRWLILLLAGVFCYLLRPVLPPHGAVAGLLVDLPTALIPPVFWLFAHQLCSEGAPFPRWAWALSGFTVLVSLLANHIDFAGSPQFQHAMYLLSQPLKLGLIAAGLIVLQQQFQSDLVEARRRLRAALLIAVGSYMLVVVCVEFLFDYLPVPNGIPTLHALLAALLSFAACLWLLALSPEALGESLPPTPEERTPPAEKTPVKSLPPLDGTQRQLLAQLQSHMNSGGYRHTGLTIRELAEQLGAREHVLRSLINRHLGYRNFNEYLNEFRINEASARLADPQQAHLPVLTIALDIGYRSLSPFNAAFKQRHQCTPTEYRREQLPA